jgi:phosphoserine phosphatase
VTTPRLVSFDLDGTLVTGTTTCLELARSRGGLEHVNMLEGRYARGEIGHDQFAEANAAAHRDWPLAEAEAAVLAMPLIGGVAETVAALKARGCHILIVTVTWSFAARTLVNFLNLDGFAGATMGERNGRLTGEVLAHFGERDKPRYVRDYGRRHGIGLDQCVAVGDSRSDLPLFGEVGRAIALNATDDARRAAHVALDTDDLRDVLGHIGDGGMAAG